MDDMGKKCDTGRKNWCSIIQHIKQNVTTTSKHQFKSKISDGGSDAYEIKVMREVRSKD